MNNKDIITDISLFREIFENGIAMLILDNNGVIKHLNHTAEEIFNRERDALIGKHFGLPILNGEKTELDIHRKNGEKGIAEIYTVELEKSGLILVTIIDITRRKKAEQELEKSREKYKKLYEKQKVYLDKLVKASQFKSNLMASISHDLRTPMNAIIGFTDLLMEESYGSVNADQLSCLTEVKESCDYLMNLINNILNISKIESGQFELNIQKVSLKTIISKITSKLKPLYVKKKLDFNIQCNTSSQFIYIDPIKFSQILRNLLSNAIKFTKEGRILLKISESETNWRFEVIDTGQGIADKDIDSVFQGFRKGDSPFIKSSVGKGLGLALTKRLIQLHQGEIGVKSELGEGSNFFFKIPKNLKFL